MASTVTLQSVVDYARTFSELTPVLSVGGQTQQPALTIAQDVIVKMLSPTMPWKWNRVNIAPFTTNAYQQDYGVPGVSNIKWLENATWVDINNTSTPKPQAPIEVVRDLQPSSAMWTPPSQLCWIPNRLLQYGVWPGVGVVYTNPIAPGTSISNPTLLMKDANGNLLVLTTYGTTGTAAPVLPANSVAGTTVTDGTVVWTVLDPDGQGFRLNCQPTKGSLTYQLRVVAQQRAPMFTSLKSTIDPIPDDDAPLFRRGFVAHAYLHSPEASVRARFPVAFQMWQESLTDAIGASDRERTEYGFYPASSIGDNGWCAGEIGPGWPFPGGL